MLKTCTVVPQSCVRSEPKAKPPSWPWWQLPVGSTAACVCPDQRVCGTPLWAVPTVWAMPAARAGRAEGTHRHHLCFLFAYFLFYFIPLLQHPLGCLKQGGGGAWLQGTLCRGCGSCWVCGSPPRLFPLTHHGPDHKGSPFPPPLNRPRAPLGTRRGGAVACSAPSGRAPRPSACAAAAPAPGRHGGRRVSGAGQWPRIRCHPGGLRGWGGGRGVGRGGGEGCGAAPCGWM